MGYNILLTLGLFAVAAIGPILTVWGTTSFILKRIRRGGFIKKMPLISALLMYVLFGLCTSIVSLLIAGAVDLIFTYFLSFAYPFLYIVGLFLSLVLIYVRGR